MGHYNGNNFLTVGVNDECIPLSSTSNIINDSYNIVLSSMYMFFKILYFNNLNFSVFKNIL